MRDWLVEIVPAGYADAVLWTAAALILLVLFLAVFRYARGFTGGTFVAGGRNRRTRLAVMDATAVDARRRLVLVRRDDVEHLILIGGPTDVVVEQDIRVSMRVPRTAPREDFEAELPMAAAEPTPPRVAPAATVHPVRMPPPQPVRPVPTPAARGTATAGPGYTRPTANGETSGPRPAPAPVSMPRTEMAAPRKPAPAPVVASPVKPVAKSLDDDLMHELEVSLDEVTSSPRTSATLEDEMNKLLGELSSGRR